MQRYNHAESLFTQREQAFPLDQVYRDYHSRFKGRCLILSGTKLAQRTWCPFKNATWPRSNNSAILFFYLFRPSFLFSLVLLYLTFILKRYASSLLSSAQKSASTFASYRPSRCILQLPPRGSLNLFDRLTSLFTLRLS